MTPQQNACLIAIRDLTVDGICPTYEQIREHLALASKSGVHRLIIGLEQQGYVRRAPFRQNRLEVIERHGGSISDARIASMSEEALGSALARISAALSHRRALSQAMQERAA